MSVLTRRGVICGCGCLAAVALHARAVAAEKSGRPDFAFDEIAPGVWRHTSWNTLPNGDYFPSNGMVVVGRERVLMVDTAWTPDQAEMLIERLDRVAAGKRIDLFVTHFHDDRLGGIGVTAARGIGASAFERTVEEAHRRKAGRFDLPLPGDAHAFMLGGREVEVFHPGPGHTADNAIAYDRETKTVFGGCLIRAASTTDLGNTADAVLDQWGASVARVAERYPDAAIVIPGHGKTGDKGLFAHTIALTGAQP